LPAAVDIADPGLVEVGFPDYLDGLREFFTRGERRAR